MDLVKASIISFKVGKPSPILSARLSQSVEKTDCELKKNILKTNQIQCSLIFQFIACPMSETHHLLVRLLWIQDSCWDTLNNFRMNYSAMHSKPNCQKDGLTKPMNLRLICLWQRMKDIYRHVWVQYPTPFCLFSLMAWYKAPIYGSSGFTQPIICPSWT